MAQFSKRCRYELNQCMIAHSTRSVEENEDLTTDLSLSVVRQDCGIAFSDQPLDEGSLGHGVAQLRHFDVSGHVRVFKAEIGSFVRGV